MGFAVGRVLVFNAGGIIVFLAAVAAWAAAQYGGHPSFRMLAGFGVMALVGAALEWVASARSEPTRRRLRPRYFWILPAWLVGLFGAGTALRDTSSAASNIVLGAAVLATYIAIGVAAARRPGGRWIVGMTVAGTIVMAFQILGYARPEWRSAPLYALNAAAMLAVVVCSVKLYTARAASNAP